MGPFSRRMKDPVEGIAQVVGVSGEPDGTHGPCRMTLVVQADGLEPTSVEFTDRVHSVKKWPNPGQTLPVKVDRADPERLEVLWDKVPEGWDVAQAQADQIAEAMRQGIHNPTTADDPTGGVVSQLKQMFPGAVVQVQTSGTEDPESMKMAEQALGIDLDGDGKVAGVTVGASAPPGAVPAASPPAAGGDRIAQLERLAKLRDQGVLSLSEFEAEKRRVLGS